MSQKNSKLLLLKWLHTIVWIILASNIFYILFVGITGISSSFVYISIILVLFECVVLLVFKWRCPITIVAEKYTNNPDTGFDIFLPKFIAKHNKTIFSIIFVVGLVLVLLRNLVK